MGIEILFLELKLGVFEVLLVSECKKMGVVLYTTDSKVRT